MARIRTPLTFPLVFALKCFSEQRVARSLQGKQRVHGRFFLRDGINRFGDGHARRENGTAIFPDASGGHPRRASAGARGSGVDGDAGQRIELVAACALVGATRRHDEIGVEAGRPLCGAPARRE